MRTRTVVPVLVALSAGLTAAAAVRRFVGRRRPAALPATPVAAPVVLQEAVGVEAVREAVVLPFARPVAAPVQQAEAVRPALPPRCGENGGRTKAGAPCAARGTVGGRCHHHRVAA